MNGDGFWNLSGKSSLCIARETHFVDNPWYGTLSLGSDIISNRLELLQLSVVMVALRVGLPAPPLEARVALTL
jgi:hypothetical protein